MGDYDFNPSEMINQRERFAPPKKLEPAIDMLVSSVVGKKVYAADPRLLKLVAKYKKMKKNDDEQDNFLQNPRFVTELKHELNKSL